MRIPAKRIRFERTWEGHSEGDGYVVIDVKGLDMEGVTTFVVTVEDLDGARAASGRQADARDELRGLFE